MFTEIVTAGSDGFVIAHIGAETDRLSLPGKYTHSSIHFFLGSADDPKLCAGLGKALRDTKIDSATTADYKNVVIRKIPAHGHSQ